MLEDNYIVQDILTACYYNINIINIFKNYVQHSRTKHIYNRPFHSLLS